jgi:transcriptional regulator with XRE-family HTH domain
MPKQETNNGRLGNYLRTHRRRTGLSQRELGYLLGYSDEGAVSRHEQSQTIPPLLSALGYEVIFRVPIAKLLPGIRLTVEQTMEARLLLLEQELQLGTGKGARAKTVAQRLAWLYERRDVDEL